jgi:hypothetical protein
MMERRLAQSGTVWIKHHQPNGLYLGTAYWHSVRGWHSMWGHRKPSPVLYAIQLVQYFGVLFVPLGTRCATVPVMCGSIIGVKKIEQSQTYFSLHDY